MELEALWHFHRPELAKQYLKLLNIGVLTSCSLFAPRRTGKTQFLLHDLLPEAQAQGFVVIYVDLWQTGGTPTAALVNALVKELEPKTLLQRAAAGLKTPIKGLKAKADMGALGKIEGEVQLDLPSKKATQEALQLADLIEALVKRGPVLLLVDEAQSLAQSAAGEDAARALRTAMTLHAKNLRVIFTGSSRTRLAGVFSSPTAPLYSAGVGVQDFPLLDEQFVRYIAGSYEKASGRVLPQKAAKELFKRFDFRPEPFIQAVVSMLMLPSLSLEKAAQQVAEKLAMTENHEGPWNALSSIEKCIVVALAEDPHTKPFAKEFVAKLGVTLGVPDLKVTSVQRALANLAEGNIVSRTRGGVFEFESASFADWVRSLP